MELKNFLQAQFEAYPTLLRDVFVFAAAEKSQVEMASVAKKVLGLPGVTILEIPHKDGDVRYQLFRHGESQGPSQKSSELAAWSFLGKAGVWDELKISTFPLLKNELYQNRSKHWSKKHVLETNKRWLKWYMSIKIARKVWALHRSTSSFLGLSPQEQIYVDAIGLGMAVMQQQAKQQLLLIGVDLSTDAKDVQLGIANAEKEVMQERQEWLPALKSRVPVDFYEKMVSFF